MPIPHNEFTTMELFHHYTSIAVLISCLGMTACSPSIPQFYYESWTNYAVCNNRCSISIPPILEKHTEQDKYTQVLGVWDPDVTIFQQKGLAVSDMAGYDDHYCRVILRSYVENDDYPASTEQFPINSELRAILRQYVDLELGDYPLLYGPTYRWINIANGNRAIEINYRREGNNYNMTNVTIYILFNSDIMVEMIVAYRESEKELWLPAVENIIYTFKWADEPETHLHKLLNTINRMDSEIITRLIVWVIMCALFALVGKNRKIGYGWTFVLCLFLSPIIGLIIALCTKKKDTDFTEVQ